MKRTYTFLIAVLAAACISAPLAHAQGCVVARSNGEIGGPDSEGGYVTPGEFDINIGYRHQFSFEHYIGDQVETKGGLTRTQLGTQVENKINLENVSLTYQLTQRFSVTANVPILTASRHTNDTNTFQLSDGIGDTSFLVSGWLWNPKENTKGNVQIGFGLQIPTGNDDVITNLNGKPTVNDYSIQPGSGGYGIVMQWSTFKSLKQFGQVYFNGSYLATPQVTNGVLRSATAGSQPLTEYNSISDQYLLETGVAAPVKKVRGLTLTLGPRWEGVPAHDLIGDSIGFRRPGYALSVEPGVQYYNHGNVFTFTIARALYRNRTISETDSLLDTHGDAAFANWVWLASYSFRFNPFHKAMSGHHT